MNSNALQGNRMIKDFDLLAKLELSSVEIKKRMNSKIFKKRNYKSLEYKS